MPHVHGVAWIAENWLKDFGITGMLVDHPEKSAELADKLLSSKRSNCPLLKKVVDEVQVHNHTRSCQKYDSMCRYGFPRLPCPKTLVAVPLPETMRKEEKEELLKKMRECMSKAKQILEDPKKGDLTFDEYLKELDVTMDEYVKYISISERGKVLITERGMKETFINNYNEEWLTAWNANMDIQLALDPFAVITYIVSYVSKDETGMTQFLKDALKSNAKGPISELLKAMKCAFLKARQMGESEAVYIVISGTRLRDSNVKTVFVASGFPENRSFFYRKVDENNPEPIVNENADQQSDDENEDLQFSNGKPCMIEGRQGTYQSSVSVNDRYACRPEVLETMCLAQFATIYTYTQKIPKDVTFDPTGKCMRPQDESDKVIFNSEISLPKYVSLEDAALGNLRLRLYPAVLRFHNSSKKEGHEKQYSELVLFSHWRDEIKELHRFDAPECIKAYQARKEEIDSNRLAIYPGEKTLLLGESNLLDNQVLHEKPSHFYDTLNAQEEQNQDDDREEGETADPTLESFGYTGNLNHDNEFNADDCKYKTINVPSDEEMKFLTKRLVPEQRAILRPVIAYCKDVIKAKSNPTHKIKPILMLIHGGSGKISIYITVKSQP